MIGKGSAKCLLCALALCGLDSVSVADEPVGNTASSQQFEDGRAVFEQWCWECHGKRNPHGSGTWSLRKRDGEEPSPYIEDRAGLTYEYLELVVRNGQRFMPRFRYTEISDSELRDMSVYLQKSPANP